MENLVKAWQAKVRQMAGQFRKLFLASGRLIQEAADGQYHTELGFNSLAEYVQAEFAVGRFPIQWREAFDRLRVVRMIDALDMKDSDLESIASVKLKLVSLLDPAKHGDQMRELLVAIKKAPVKCDMHWVQQRVDELRGKVKPTEAEEPGENGENGGSEHNESATKTYSFKVPASVESVIEAALALFANAGESKSARFVALCEAVAKASASNKAMAA